MPSSALLGVLGLIALGCLEEVGKMSAKAELSSFTRCMDDYQPIFSNLSESINIATADRLGANFTEKITSLILSDKEIRNVKGQVVVKLLGLCSGLSYAGNLIFHWWSSQAQKVAAHEAESRQSENDVKKNRDRIILEMTARGEPEEAKNRVSAEAEERVQDIRKDQAAARPPTPEKIIWERFQDFADFAKHHVKQMTPHWLWCLCEYGFAFRKSLLFKLFAPGVIVWYLATKHENAWENLTAMSVYHLGFDPYPYESRPDRGLAMDTVFAIHVWLILYACRVILSFDELEVSLTSHYFAYLILDLYMNRMSGTVYESLPDWWRQKITDKWVPVVYMVEIAPILYSAYVDPALSSLSLNTLWRRSFVEWIPEF